MKTSSADLNINEHTTQKSCRVLIVEDEFIIATDLSTMLTRLGHEVVAIAGTIKDAKTAIEKELIDIVLLDINLEKEFDGIALASEIEKRAIPFIFTTGRSDPYILSKVKHLQPYGFIVKPYNEKEIFATIEIAIQKSTVENISRQEQEKKLLLDINSAIATVRLKEDLLKVITEKIKPIFGFSHILISELEETKTKFRLFFSEKETYDSLYSEAYTQWIPVGDSLSNLINSEDAFGIDNIPIKSADAETYSILLSRLDAKQCVHVLLRSGRETIGFLSMVSSGSHRFLKDQIPIIKAVSEQIAIAVSNILAYRKIVKQKQEQESLLALSDSIASIRSRADLIDVVTQKLHPLFLFDDAMVLVGDSQLANFHNFLSASADDVSWSEKDQSTETLRSDDSFLDMIIKADGAVILKIDELSEKYPNHHGVQLLFKMGIKQALCSTLKYSENVIGCLIFHTQKPDFYQPDVFNIFKAVADQISIAVGNIMANEEIAQRDKEKTTLVEISKAIATIDNAEALFQITTDKLQTVLGEDILYVLVVFNDKGKHAKLYTDWNKLKNVPDASITHFQSNNKISIKGSVFESVINAPSSFLVDIQEIFKKHPHDASVKAAANLNLKQAIISPLRYQGNIVGSLHIHSAQKNRFKESHFDLLNAISEQLAVAFSNAKAKEEILSREREKSLQLELNNELVSSKNFKELSLTVAKKLDGWLPFKFFILQVLDLSGTILHQYIFEQNQGKTELLKNHFPDSTAGTNVVEEKLSKHQILYDLDRKKLNKIGLPSLPIENAIMFRSPLRKKTSLHLTFGTNLPGAYQKKHLTFLKHLVPQITLAAENRLSVQALRVKQNRRNLQLNVINAITSIPNRHDLLKAMMNILNGHIPIHGLSFTSADDSNDRYSSLIGINRNDKIEVIEEETFIQTAGFTQPNYHESVNSAEALYMLPSLNLGDTYKELCAKFEIVRTLSSIYGFKSSIYAPIFNKDKWISTLTLYSQYTHGFSTEDMESITELSEQIALALENRQAFETLNRLKHQLEQEKSYLKEEIDTNYKFEDIVGVSPKIVENFNQISQVAPSDMTVLIQGETGTGKELFARAVHNLSNRKNKPLIKLNCAALPPNLLESELFGHEKGAFTGATEQRIGKFELAHQGSIFLDEIGEMPLELQSKLLRAIQEKEIEKLGSNKTIKVDVRIIAATNRNLKEEVDAGNFRSDLYYRLNVIPIVVPPLRDRTEDIPLLAQHFLQKANKRLGRRIRRLSEESMEKLMSYSWPGNIREMEHVIERSSILCHDETLEIILQPSEGSEEVPQTSNGGIMSLEEAEKDLVLRVLKHTNGKIRGKGGAAEVLKINPNTLDSRMKKLGIKKERLIKG
ncbi:MAG: sigma 54-interacting transcriptional regulator [Bacteroidota bacterium]